MDSKKQLIGLLTFEYNRLIMDLFINYRDRSVMTYPSYIFKEVVCHGIYKLL